MQNLFVSAYWKAIFVIMIALAFGTLLSAEFNICFDEYKKLFQREQKTFQKLVFFTFVRINQKGLFSPKY
jgi:hypothetical protein